MRRPLETFRYAVIALDQARPPLHLPEMKRRVNVLRVPQVQPAADLHLAIQVRSEGSTKDSTGS